MFEVKYFLIANKYIYLIVGNNIYEGESINSQIKVNRFNNLLEPLFYYSFIHYFGLVIYCKRNEIEVWICLTPIVLS